MLVLFIEIPCKVVNFKDNSDDLVLIGEKKEYKPLSREAFVKKMVNRNKK
jgi:hypothetical protein